MKKALLVLGLVILAGCAKERNLEATLTGRDGRDGRDGVDGVSCTVSALENGSKISCSDGSEISLYNGTNGQNGSDGEDGADGSSCSLTAISESSSLLSCTDGSSMTVSNGIDGRDGTDGSDGQDGSDGEDGEDALGATLSLYSSSSCVKISGTSSYTKSTGSGNRGLYTSSSCSSSSKFAEVSQGEAYWVSNTSLATLTDDGDLRVITFN